MKKTYFLGDVVNIKYGKNQSKVKDENGSIPILGTGGLMGYANKALYTKPSVLIGRKGSISKVKYVDEPFWTVDTLFYTEVNETIVYPHYLYYLLSVIDFNYYNEGTTIPSLRTETLNQIQIDIPDLITQRKVLDILECIDEKIELNNKLNANLEEMGLVLYKKFFIDEYQESWIKGTIVDLGAVVGGSTPSKSKDEYYCESGIPWITPKDLSKNKNKFIERGDIDITELGLQKSSAKVMPAGTVLFSSRAPIGYIAIAKNEVTTNQGFKSVVPNENIGTAYIYYFLKYNLEKIENMASGSTFKEVSGTIMKNIEAIIPDEIVLKEFNMLCMSIFKQQEILEEENQRLMDLRDILLPKLMSGDIDLSEVEVLVY